MLTVSNGNHAETVLERSSLVELIEVLRGIEEGQKRHESQLLEDLSRQCLHERCLSTHIFKEEFRQIFEVLIKQRLDKGRHHRDFYQSEYFLRILIWIKIFIRDPYYQKELFHMGGVKILSESLRQITEDYLSFEDELMGIEVLKLMTNIFQKLCVEPSQRLWLMACDVPRSLVLLLCARDLSVLNCALFALIDLVKSVQTRVVIGDMNCVETLLHILQEYNDPYSKRLSSELLKQLCILENVRSQIKVYDGIPLCLSVLHDSDLVLLFNVVSIVEKLCIDNESSSEIRELGGIPLILTLIQDGTRLSKPDELRQLTRTYSECSDDQQRGGSPFDSRRCDTVRLHTACCATLTQLSLNDANAQNIVYSNGVFILGRLILPPEEAAADEDTELREMLQLTALRALRFLFSMERNRQLFKRLFPTELFEMFIDVGHYITNIHAYKDMLHYINNSSEEARNRIKCRIHNTNQNRAPMFFVGQYAVLEHLGSGAFGNVYKVKKSNGGNEDSTFLAMKEISIQHPVFGNTTRERSKSIGDILNETNIIKEQLRHPNIVRYYKTFKNQNKLYIVMQYIDGAPLSEHFSSLREKGLSFSEERIWAIFVQMVLALRYLHCEKGVVHRDLTPNNVMLGDNDKLTLTDFGLSRQKQGLMQSVVGTILYSCPELVQNQPYDSKADIWAIGCLLYQMCTLQHPFYKSDMSTLALAKNIVEAIYEPISSEVFSEKMIETVKKCLTPDPAQRPDIVGVGSSIAEIIMRDMDEVRVREATLHKKLLREKKRVQKHYHESTRNLQNYQRLFLATNPSSVGSSSCTKCSARSLGNGMSTEDSSFDEQDFQTTTTTTSQRCSCAGRGKRKTLLHSTSATILPSRSKHTHSGSCTDVNSGGGSRCRRVSGNTSRNMNTISISHRKVKQIDDPILQILNQIHKIIFISQRRVIEKYKRALFSPHIGSINLKNELKKLMEASKDIVDLNFRTISRSPSAINVVSSNSLHNLSLEGSDGAEVLSYENLQNLIESCLTEAGYYDMYGTQLPAVPPIEQVEKLFQDSLK